MSLVIVILISSLIMLGLLVVPYSAAAGIVLIAIGVGALGLVFWRAGKRFRTVLIGTAVVCLALFVAWNFVLMPWANQEVISELHLDTRSAGQRLCAAGWRPEGQTRDCDHLRPGRSDTRQ